MSDEELIEKINLQIQKDKAIFMIAMGVFFVAMGIVYLIMFFDFYRAIGWI